MRNLLVNVSNLCPTISFSWLFSDFSLSYSQFLSSFWVFFNTTCTLSYIYNSFFSFFSKFYSLGHLSRLSADFILHTTTWVIVLKYSSGQVISILKNLQWLPSACRIKNKILHLKVESFCFCPFLTFPSSSFIRLISVPNLKFLLKYRQVALESLFHSVKVLKLYVHNQMLVI